MSSSGKVNSSYTFHNEVKLLRGGIDFFNELDSLIKKAQKTIQIQIYIFDEDQTGTSVIHALKSASLRGVRIQLLLDGYASRKFSKDTVKELRSLGMQFRFFDPLLTKGNFYFGRRLHHKIVVCDEQYALVGGLNISDRYNDLPGSPAWLDWAIRVQGEATIGLAKICNQRFYKKQNPQYHYQSLQPETNIPVLQGNCPVRIRQNDWIQRKNQISATYMEMMKQAKSEIIIMSSYFIPGAFFRRNIIKALARGVKIKLILAGISDVGISKYAERHLYHWALKNGMEIFEYQHNVLHGKMAVCDRKMTTIGAYNINDLSALASIELNLDIDQKEFALMAVRVLEQIIENDCIQISPEQYLKQMGLVEKSLHWISYEIVRALMKMFTFYFRKEKNNGSA